MSDKEYIEKMLIFYKQYREEMAKDFENPVKRKRYFSILIDKSLPNKLEDYNNLNKLEKFKRIQKLDKNFYKFYLVDKSCNLKQIWDKSILTLLTNNKKIEPELRSFYDTDEMIKNSSMKVSISKYLDEKINEMEFERKKLQYNNYKMKKEHN